MNETAYFQQFIGDEPPLPLHFPDDEIWREFGFYVSAKGDGHTFIVSIWDNDIEFAAYRLEKLLREKFLRRFVTIVDARDITHPNNRGTIYFFQFDVRL